MAMGSSATDQVERNWNFKRHVKATFTGVEIYSRNRIYIIYIHTYIYEHLLYRFHLFCSSCDKCDKPVTIVSCGFALWAAQSPSFTASYSCRVCLEWVSGHSVKSYLPHLPEPTYWTWCKTGIPCSLCLQCIRQVGVLQPLTEESQVIRGDRKKWYRKLIVQLLRLDLLTCQKKQSASHIATGCSHQRLASRRVTSCPALRL